MTAYAIFIHESTTDPAELATYDGLVRSTAVGHPLSVLALNGALSVLEGQPSEGVVLISFPSMVEATAWYESPAYRDAAKHRHAGASFRVLLTEGLS